MIPRRLHHFPASLAAIALVAMLLPTAQTQAASPVEFDSIDAYVRAEMAASSLPGLSYAIVRDGEIVHLAAFGAADSTGRAMTTDTPVVLGSVGKTLTALAVRQLIEAGKIEADAPVQRYLPWFTLATPGAAAEITIRNLLDQTSGLSRADGQRPDIYRPALTSEEVIRGLGSVAVNRPVGTFEYSNLNYVTLGVVVEAVSGQPYAAYLHDRVFDPLGMSHSYSALEPAKRDGLAQGHRYLFGLPVAWDEPYPTAIVPAGYQISTAADMARYAAAFSNHGRFHGTDIVGDTGGDRDYSIYWEPVTGVPWGYTPGHSGATLTENTGLIYMPIEHLGVVVLTNANPTELWLGSPRGASEIAFDVLRLARAEDPLTGGPTVINAYVVVDAVLLLFGGLLVVETIRLRGWHRRLTGARRRRLALVPSFLVDVLLPLSILVVLPLWISTMGMTPAFDVLGTWAVAMWTLPDLGASLLAISAGLLIVGAVKAWQLWWHRDDERPPIPRRPADLADRVARLPTAQPGDARPTAQWPPGLRPRASAAVPGDDAPGPR
jgi:CubicO group peptidase (beta-lactamase class C family)